MRHKTWIAAALTASIALPTLLTLGGCWFDRHDDHDDRDHHPEHREPHHDDHHDADVRVDIH